jgi:hypothetical protein
MTKSTVMENIIGGLMVGLVIGSIAFGILKFILWISHNAQMVGWKTWLLFVLVIGLVFAWFMWQEANL